MSYSYEKLSFGSFKEVGAFDRVVEFKLPLQDGNDVTKVLSIVADGKAIKAEAGEGDVQFSGRVNFRLVYLSSSDEVSSLDYFADFDEKIEAPVKMGAVTFATADVIETDATGGSELTLSAVVKIKIYSILKEECECLATVPQECYADKSVAVVKTLGDYKLHEFTVTDEIVIGGDIEKILSTDSCIVVNEIKAGENACFITGNFYSVVTYLMGGEIKSANYDTPFSEEVLINGLIPDDGISFNAEVKNVRLIISGTEGNNNLEIESLNEIRINVYKKNEIEIVKDVFMLSKELSVEKDELSLTPFKNNFLFCDKVTETAKLSESRSAVRNILAVSSATNNIASVWAETGKIYVEGIICATIIYTDENGLNSVKVELPYSLPFNADVDGSENVYGKGDATDVSVRIKRDRELEVSVKLCFKFEITTKYNLSYIKNIEEGADKPLNTSAMSVYIASENDTIWDVAKALSASPDKILAQNELPEILHEGDRVIFFRELS